MPLLGVVPRMLHNPLARRQSQIQPAMPRVPLLKLVHNAECMQVMVETQLIALKTAIQCTLPGMSKGRMPDVMNQCQGLCEVLIQTQSRRNLPRHLRHLHRVRQAASKVVRRPAGKDLGLAR